MQSESVSKPYFTRAKGNVLMKSVTIAIRNSKQRIIGLLCININLDVPVSQFMQAFMQRKNKMKPLPSILQVQWKNWWHKR